MLKNSINIFIVSILILFIPANVLCKKKAVAQENSAELEELYKQLESENSEEVLMAVQMLGVMGDKNATPALKKLLDSGRSSDVTEIVIQTMGFLGVSDCVKIIVPYTNHRRVEIRMAALTALESLESPLILDALYRLLSDSNNEIREKAAMMIAKKGDSSYVPLLFNAFEKGVNNAAFSIGRLGGDQDAIRFVGFIGQIDIGILIPGFENFILGDRISTQTSLHVLELLFDLAGPDIREFAIKTYELLSIQEDKDKQIINMLHSMAKQIATS